MRKTIFGAVLAALLLAGATSVFAREVQTGKWLYEAYQGWKKSQAGTGTPQNVLDSGYYMGYVTGIADAQAMRIAAGAKPVWCEPKGAQYAQYFDVVGRYLEAHPERRKRQRAVLVYEALRQAWPCPKR